jgi:phosphoribosylanthranilate isomerase
VSGVVVKVKVCGVTRVADALAAAAAGADAVALNFWRPGRRCVSAARAQEIVAALLAAHPRVLPVAVFVDAPLDEVEHTLVSTGCRAAQLHGDEPPALVAALGARAWKVLRHGGPPGAGAGAAAADIEARARTFPGVTLLVDTAGAALPGGTGVASGASCAAVRRLRAGGREVWLAGGLTPANVGAAIAACAPSGVDVASGVETAPGVKDEALVRAFVAAVRVAASPPA